MDYTFLLMVIVVSSSGVLSPGPLFLINIHYAKRYGHLSGLLCASGHAVVELPLVLAIAVGILSIDYMDRLGWLIGLVGGVALIAFSTIQIYTLATTRSIQGQSNNARVLKVSTALYGSFIAGMAFSALNPFFIAWWLTVGMKMIVDASYIASINGVLLMFLLHIWMDYAWLMGTAYMARKGMDKISRLGSNAMLLYIALYAILVYIGINFILSSL